MTTRYRLCLTRDDVGTAPRPLPAITRVLYVLHGRVAIDAGSPRVEVGDRTIAPGQAWFESGREAVYAKASATEATSFIRCSILPAEIRGKSSIVYVDPAHAASKPRRYTVLVDEPIALP